MNALLSLIFAGVSGGRDLRDMRESSRGYLFLGRMGGLMRAERRMVFACVFGMALCLALSAKAEEPTGEDVVLERCVLVGIVALPLVAVANSQRWLPELAPLHQYEWDRLAEDKRLHIEVEAKIGLGFSSFLFAFMPSTSKEYLDRHDNLTRYEPWHRWAYAGGSCMALGIAKEGYDEARFQLGHHQYGADYEDLVADAAGCAGGVVAGASLGTATRLSMSIVIGADGGAVLVGRTF